MNQSKNKLEESKPRPLTPEDFAVGPLGSLNSGGQAVFFYSRAIYRIVVFQFLFFDVLENIARADNHRAKTHFHTFPRCSFNCLAKLSN
jgi:hypothetical protein